MKARKNTPGPYAGPYDCPECGTTHPKGCRGHVKLYNDHGDRTGQRPCLLPPRQGLTVCWKHGAGSPQAKAKAERVIEEQRADQAATEEVRRLGARTDVHPAVALVELVQLWSGHVAYWSQVVTDLEAENGHECLTWGRTSQVDKGSGEFPGTDTTEAAAPHVAYTMLERASARLESAAAAALRAGVDERRVQLAERQGALVADVIRSVLERLNLTDEQRALIPTVVPEQLRLLTASKETQPR